MGLKLVEPYWSDFLKFAEEHVKSWDVDPAYPLLKSVYRMKVYSKEEALLHTLAFVGFYRLDSAEDFMQRFLVTRRIPDTSKIDKAIERRGFRGNDRFGEYFQAAKETLQWWDFNWRIRVPDSPEIRWTDVRQSFELIKWNGSWASYKFADLLKNVHGYDISAPDFGVGGGGETAGPIPGMVKITGKDWKTCANDISLQRELYEKALKRVPFNGMEMMETSLCDFNSWTKGRYYVGHDIDSQMEQITGLDSMYWEARKEIFDPKYLGEIHGYHGVQKNRMRK